MSRQSTTVDRTRPVLDPVGFVVAELAGGEQTPDLGRLAMAVIDSLSCWPGALRLAVVIDPEWGTLLDRSWSRRRDNCLVGTTHQPPRWLALPGGWQVPAKETTDCQGTTLCDRGPLPGGALWRTDKEPAAAAWAAVPVRALGHDVATVVLELEPASEEYDLEQVADSLTALGRILSLVAGLWAENVSLAAELAQARDEKTSLSRLNRLQGRFVAMASHEFKTPLTSITAYTDVLRSQLMDDQFPHAGEFLDVVKTEAGRLLRMVNRIVEFTRVEYGSQLLTRRPTDLRPLVDETVLGLQPAIEDKALSVTIEAGCDLPRAEVDADLIRQVLVNLIGNAVKYTPQNGSIVISISELASVVAVSVADDGPGIPEDDIRKVFREFYRAEGKTAEEEGTGLGLTIARHIVNLHGGHIEAQRRPTGGSEFRFLVPKESGTAAKLPAALGPAASEQGATDLVAELLRLMAELTGSRAVALLVRDGDGALVPVGALGWQVGGCDVRPIIENKSWTRFLQAGRAVAGPGTQTVDLNWCPHGVRTGEFMCAPLGSGETALGAVITGRRQATGRYTPADLAQLSILAEVAKAALYSMNTSIGRTVEAVRLLLRIRRTGVPTSTSEALELLAALAQRLGVGDTGTRRLQYAAALHDAGMGRVEEEIVMGDAELNVDQRDEVDRHVEQGVDLMAPLLTDAATTDIIRFHHERFDGTGHPAGLAGEEIPLGSRLLAVIDAWFSVTRPRPFRDGLAPQAAMAEIESHAGTQFDPAVVREFRTVLIQQHILPETAQGTARPVPETERP